VESRAEVFEWEGLQQPDYSMVPPEPGSHIFTRRLNIFFVSLQTCPREGSQNNFPIALKLESESAILSMVMMTVRRVVLEQAQEDLRGDKKNSERWACKSRRKRVGVYESFRNSKSAINGHI
jgi:hypothetical protein